MTQAETVQAVLEEIKSLEPLPQVAARVMQIAEDEDLVPSDLVRIIETDAALTAKILKLCNSAYYGFQREVASLQDAGNLLGCTTLVNLVLTSCTGRYFRDYGKQNGNSATAWWERSVATALATSHLAGMRGGVDRGRAYTAGLLENFGQLVFQRYLPEIAEQLEQELAAGVKRLDAERMLLGIDHAEVGAQLAERWGFPESLVEAIRCHHEPERAVIDPLLASFAHLGEMVMQRLELGEGLEPLAYDLKRSALGLAGMSQDNFDALEDRLRGEIERAKELVDLS